MYYIVRTTSDGYRIRTRHSRPIDTLMCFVSEDTKEVEEHLTGDCGVNIDQCDRAIAHAQITEGWVDV